MSEPRERYEKAVESSADPGLLVDASSGRILKANAAAARKYGYARSQLAGLPIETLWPDARQALSQKAASGAARALWHHQRKDGQLLNVSVDVQEVPGANARLLRVAEVSTRAFSLALLESEGGLIQRIARGGPLERILQDIVVAIERLSSGMLGSVLLLGEDGTHVRHGAAPHLPLAYWSAIDGASIGPAAGSCGTAIYTAKQVVVADIAKDPRWRAYRQLALPHGLRACWSTPIFSRRKRVVGAFALYYRDVRAPGPREKRLVQVASDLAAIAIERDAAERAHRGAGAQPPAPARDAPPAHDGLSAREVDVLRLIAHGAQVKQVASKLHLSLSTVYTYRARLLEKLGLRSNVDLARYAAERGLMR